MRKNPVLLFPVRRKLMGWTIAYLLGIFAAQMGFSIVLSVLICAFSMIWGILRARHRKSAFLCVFIFMFFFGNGWAGAKLSIRDSATLPNTAIAGEVDAIQSGNRVWLKNVVCGENDAKAHRVLVTLMGDAENVRVGQRVSGIGRLFEPDEPRNAGGTNKRIYALTRNYELSGYILEGWEAQGEEKFSLSEILRSVRSRLLNHMESTFGESAPLFEAILLGERKNMDDDVVNAMRLTGTVHLLTVSGLHLTLIAELLESILKKITWRRKRRFVIQTVLLCLFTALTGAAAGTVRALIMASLRSWARCRGRRYEPLTGLSAAAWVMTVYNPVWVLDTSFQFSFSVVLGILLLRERVSDGLKKHSSLMRKNAQMRELLCISLCAQIAALPMQLTLYGYFSPVSLFINLITGMMMPYLMNGGLLCAGIAAVIPELKRWTRFAASIPIQFFENVSLKFAKVGVIRLPAPYPWMIFAAFILMALAGNAIRFGKGKRRAFISAAFVMVMGYACRFYPAWRYVQLDVGQGDAAVLRHGRQAVLIDVGKADGDEMLRYLRHEGLNVDMLILSHLDEDHAGALKELMDSEIAIGKIVYPVGISEEEACDTVRRGLNAVHQSGASVYKVGAGEEIEALGERISVLAPGEWKKKTDNDFSLVLYTEIEGTRILLTGDSPITSEKYEIPVCDVLKVAHHGSKNATSDAFIAQTQPQIALISVGTNHYGHPAQRVVDLLEESGAEVLRTDECGCITIFIKGQTVQTYL